MPATSYDPSSSTWRKLTAATKHSNGESLCRRGHSIRANEESSLYTLSRRTEMAWLLGSISPEVETPMVRV